MITTSHLHPITVHFPIALLLLGMFAEILAVTRKDNKLFAEGAFYLLLLGSLACVAAWFTGEFLTEEMTGKAGEIRELHDMFAKVVTFGSLGLSALFIYYHLNNSKILRRIILLVYCVLGIAIIVTAYYGGVLVYDYMIK